MLHRWLLGTSSSERKTTSQSLRSEVSGSPGGSTKIGEKEGDVGWATVGRVKLYSQP